MTRRRLLLGGAALVAATVLPDLRGSDALAQVVSRARFRSIDFVNAHTGERLAGTYWREGRYLPEAFGKIDWFLRDFREERVAEMDPILVDVVWALQQMAGGRRQVVVTSGFRTWRTNEMLRRILPGVAKDSYHLRGRAMDITVPGVNLHWLREAAVVIRAGGVGYYPRSNFIHVDTGPVRYW